VNEHRIGEVLDARKPMVAWFDGATEVSNPGPLGIGVVLSVDGVVIDERSERRGVGTSNEAEWHALIEALKVAAQYGASSLTVYGDSQLVINQITGNWKVNQDHLRQLRIEARRHEARIPGGVEYVWIRREFNRDADRLSRLAFKEGR
jgi:ribonuclease HI